MGGLETSHAVDWSSVVLLGIDVGFSERRNTTGIAAYRFGRSLKLRCIGSKPEHRAAVLNDGARYDAIAIDGPIVAEGSPVTARHCEHVLARRPFGARCKAGFSHFGTGLRLRNAATAIAVEAVAHARRPQSPIVEAFPNAFLGVLLEDASFDAPIPRAKKSDIFFAHATRQGCFDRLFDRLGWHDDALRRDIATWATEPSRLAHEYRAAIVCVLTAGCALSGRSVPVGDDAGGYICLPPIDTWADWARASQA